MKATRIERRLEPAVVKQVVKAVVRVAKPETIVLFGSAARGEIGPNSDVDLLVVKRGKFDRWRVMNRIHESLPGTEAIDVVVATPEEVERYRDTPCMVICPALKEGKVVYESKAAAARRSARIA